MEKTDDDLLAGYLDGKVEDLESLITRYRRPLYGFILRMVSSRHDADEIFQDVWMRVIQKCGTYKPGRFKGWVFRIAHNLIVDQGRSRKIILSIDERIHADDESTLQDIVPDGRPGPAATVHGRDLAQRIEQALDMISPEQKEVFLMRMEAGMPFKEIAKAQAISINTALARMHYAVSSMRKILGELKGKDQL